VKALVVDFGGVLTTNVFESFRAFCEHEGLEPDAVKKLFKERGEGLELLRQLERGEVSNEDFSPRFGALLGVRDTTNLTQRLFAGVAPDEPMVEAVRRAKQGGIRTGLISNSWGDRGQYDDLAMDGMFDAVLISGEVGLNKPEPEIFRLGAERLGVPPEDCVFVDDLKENCEGAEAVGMTAILHRGAERTLPELERLLGVTLAA
jgi:epoxide hydrolase-like predicted phosphatase